MVFAPVTGEARFEALGFSFALECEDAELQDYLEGVLAAFAFGGPVAHRYVLRSTGEPSEELPHEVLLDGERIAGAAVGWAMVDSVVHDLNRRVVDSSPHLLLHAGGVAGDGAAAALPGHMEAGKTTLTAGLVRAGLTYLTDEALALDRESLLVHPYPKPLSIDPGAWPFFAGLAPPPVPDGGFEYVQWQVPATAIRPGAVAAPCPVVVVVFPATRRASTLFWNPSAGRRRSSNWPRTPSGSGSGEPPSSISSPISSGAWSATD